MITYHSNCQELFHYMFDCSHRSSLYVSFKLSDISCYQRGIIVSSFNISMVAIHDFADIPESLARNDTVYKLAIENVL